MLRRLVVPALALALIAAGCGGGDDGGSEGGKARPTTLHVGVIPVSNVASLFVGIEKGFFERENLKIETHMSEGGAEVVPSVVSGDLDVGYSNIPSLLLAEDKGLPIQIVAGAGGGEATQDADDSEIIAKLFARKGGRIGEPKDLEGGSVAVNTLNNIVHFTTMASLEKHGVDIDKVKFLEVPFPEMLPALEARRVDAAFLVTPFAQQATAAGHRVIAHPYFDVKPGYVNTAYFATREFAERDGDALDRFVRAIRRSIEYSGKHPDEVRATLPSFTKIPEKLIDEVPLGQIDSELNRGMLDTTVELLQRYKAIDGNPDMEAFVREGALVL